MPTEVGVCPNRKYTEGNKTDNNFSSHLIPAVNKYGNEELKSMVVLSQYICKILRLHGTWELTAGPGTSQLSPANF